MTIQTVKGAVLSILLFMVTVLLAGAAPDSLTGRQRALNLESFDYVWKTIHEKHYDPGFGGLDWKAVYDELRPAMDTVRSSSESAAVLADMVSRLGLSHFSIIPYPVYANLSAGGDRMQAGGISGCDLRMCGGRIRVVSVSEKSPAQKAGINPGWELTAVDGRPLCDILEPLRNEFAGKTWYEYIVTAVAIRQLSGAPGDTVNADFLDGLDQKVETQLVLVREPGKKIQFGYLPPFYLTIRTDTLAAGTGYFYFNCFFDPVTLMSAFNDAMQSFLNAPGFILDLRGNPGGIGSIASGMAGWFIGEKGLSMGTLITRESQLHMVVNPRVRVYEGPVAVLVDALSGSSAEFLAGGLQDLGRARVFGTPTMGAALPSVIEKLPNGDGFQYAFGNYISASGKPLEGIGVIPDEEIRPDRESLLRGKDPVLEAAVAWIHEENSKIAH